MKFKVIIRKAEEIPAISGCITKREMIKELIQNLYDAGEGCLSV